MRLLRSRTQRGSTAPSASNISEVARRDAASEYEEGVFLTITSDIPAEDIAVHSQLLHRLRSWPTLWLHTTIVRNEPQSNLTQACRFLRHPEDNEKKRAHDLVGSQCHKIPREHGSSHPKEGTDFPICEECGEGVVGDVEERM